MKTSASGAPGPVTSKSFQERGRAYIAAHGAVSINKREHPSQWWAWRDYRRELGLGCRFMDHQGDAGKDWTVPASWPADFDPPPTDELAGEPARAYRADIDG